MNNLEKEILAEIEGHMMNNEDDDPCLYKGGESQAAAKSVAEVVIRWIEEAYDAGWKAINDAPYWSLDEERKQWLRDSVLTPTEPDTKEPKQ